MITQGDVTMNGSTPSKLAQTYKFIGGWPKERNMIQG